MQRKVAMRNKLPYPDAWKISGPISVPITRPAARQDSKHAKYQARLSGSDMSDT